MPKCKLYQSGVIDRKQKHSDEITMNLFVVFGAAVIMPSTALFLNQDTGKKLEASIL